jgi:hypothetical protein
MRRSPLVQRWKSGTLASAVATSLRPTGREAAAAPADAPKVEFGCALTVVADVARRRGVLRWLTG